MPRYETLRQIRADGHNIRIWCYGCQRATIVDDDFWYRLVVLWRLMSIEKARARFVCKVCGERHPLIVSASKVWAKPPAPPKERTWQQEVEHWFFNVRPSYKSRRR